VNLPALGACALLLLVCIVALIVQHEERQQRKGLPKPHDDTRDWTGAFMRDVKRHGR